MVVSPPVAAVEPFRALRYDEAAAGPLESLVAPPYDVISPDERDHLRSRSPYNVVHLTLPDSEAEARRLFRDWRARDVLSGEDEPSFWALSQTYVGPDGLERTRTGLVATVRVEPYERRASCPTSGRTVAPRRAGSGCCARFEPSSNRSSCSTRASGRSTCRRRRPTSRSKARASGGSGGGPSSRRASAGSSF